MDTLALFASAVAGRVVELRPSQHGVYADGTVLHLPDAAAEDLAAAVACQAALLAAGTFEPATMKRLVRAGDAPTVRFLGLEVVRACGGLADVLPRQIVADVHAYSIGVPVTSSPADSLAHALSKETLPAPPAWFGELRPREATFDPRTADGIRSDRDSFERPDRSITRRSALRRQLRARSGWRASERRASGEEITVVGRRSPHGSRVDGRGVDVGTVTMGGLQVRGRRYPEWDDHAGRYRDAWCTVAELDPALTDRPLSSSTDNRSLLRALARLGLRHALHPRETEGDDLDLSGLVEHRVDIMTGVSGVPRVHRAERRTEPDLAVLVLLDATGSTADDDGPLSVFEAQRALASALTTAFHELGQRVATHAFQTHGRHGVQLLHCKDFAEPWTARARHRLESLEPAGFTRLGAVVRHGTHLLTQDAGTRHRLMVVVGDGTVYDDGYDGRYAVADARRAIAEAATSGIACVGLSTAAPPDHPVWPSHASARAADPTALAQLALPLFAGALKQASRSARSHAV